MKITKEDLEGMTEEEKEMTLNLALAAEIVLMEDRELFKELAKY